MKVVIPVVAAAGTVIFLLVPFLVCQLLKTQNKNNDENERRRLLGNGAVDQVHNPIEEGPAGRSQPVPVASSRGKADVNVGSAQVWGYFVNSCLVFYSFVFGNDSKNRFRVPRKYGLFRSPITSDCSSQVAEYWRYIYIANIQYSIYICSRFTWTLHETPCSGVGGAQC